MSENHFDLISGHFRSIRDFFGNFGQNGCRRPFWILAILDQYRLSFYFLQIFDKMADVGHFGCPNFTFDCIFWPFQIDMQL